jgi:hypothetical protein
MVGGQLGRQLGGGSSGGGNMFFGSGTSFTPPVMGGYNPFSPSFNPGGGGPLYGPGYQFGGDMGPEGGIVGEEGPEYFQPHVPGRIIPNPQTQQRMASGPGAFGGMPFGAGSDGGAFAPFGQPNIPPGGVGALGGLGSLKPQFGMGWQQAGA